MCVWSTCRGRSQGSKTRDVPDVRGQPKVRIHAHRKSAEKEWRKNTRKRSRSPDGANARRTTRANGPTPTSCPILDPTAPARTDRPRRHGAAPAPLEPGTPSALPQHARQLTHHGHPTGPALVSARLPPHPLPPSSAGYIPRPSVAVGEVGFLIGVGWLLYERE